MLRDDFLRVRQDQHESKQAASPNGPGVYTPGADVAQLHTPPDLALDQHILDRFTGALHLCGVVGEDRAAKLIYLGVTSRFLDEPVSMGAKGVSSVGKSYTLEATLKFFPPDAFFEMTAMSERALVYSNDDFQHRTLVLFEAVALREQREKTESNLTAYLVRSLLSEGRIRYPVTVRDNDGSFTTKVIEKNGPTNLILTTTAVSLHGENETRLLSLPMNDTRAQTAAIMLQLARGKAGEFNFTPWHDLQRWLGIAEHRVFIPYAERLARQIPPVAVRLRRDFRAVLRLIDTHAILHQATRDRDEQGRIVATDADYQVVRELVADLVSDGLGATVSETMRETVECVRAIAGDEAVTVNAAELKGATVNAVAAELKLDRSAAQRRLTASRERGYLVNLEDRRGRPARYVGGEPMPDEVEVLPRVIAPCTAHDGETAGQTGVCSCAVPAEGVMSEDPLEPVQVKSPDPICIICNEAMTVYEGMGEAHPTCASSGTPADPEATDDADVEGSAADARARLEAAFPESADVNSFIRQRLAEGQDDIPALAQAIAHELNERKTWRPDGLAWSGADVRLRIEALRRAGATSPASGFDDPVLLEFFGEEAT